MAASRTGILVRMPAALKSALAREVARRGSTLNDIAVQILADRFGVHFEPSGRKGSVPGTSGDVLLRVPTELKERLQGAAEASASTTNRLVVDTLSEELRGKEPMASTNGKQNGRARSEDKVRVAIIGVGNCANSLLQGVEYYKDADPAQFVPGLMHVDLGGYHVGDVEFTAAFDVTSEKVGKDLAEAIWAPPNDTIRFAEVPRLGITVSRGMTHDGLGKYLSSVVEKAPGETDDVAGILQETGTDVVVSYLPVGSEEATKWYAEQVLNAGCALVNCMPVFIARERYWQRRFEDRGLPVIGDDIKSQVGATITHRVLTSLFRERGVRLDRTMQLNVGGNSDFLNMLERERLESKKISKTNAVTSMLDYDMGAENVHVGPSDYVPWLTDRKWAYIRMEGTSFGDVPLNVELKLEVWDSPNSAGIVIDAVRLAKLALNNGVSGALEGPSAYLMKSPPKQIQDDEARDLTEAFIRKHARKRANAAVRAIQRVVVLLALEGRVAGALVREHAKLHVRRAGARDGEAPQDQLRRNRARVEARERVRRARVDAGEPDRRRDAVRRGRVARPDLELPQRREAVLRRRPGEAGQRVEHGAHLDAVERAHAAGQVDRHGAAADVRLGACAIPVRRLRIVDERRVLDAVAGDHGALRLRRVVRRHGEGHRPVLAGGQRQPEAEVTVARRVGDELVRAGHERRHGVEVAAGRRGIRVRDRRGARLEVAHVDAGVHGRVALPP